METLLVLVFKLQYLKNKVLRLYMCTNACISESCYVSFPPLVLFLLKFRSTVLKQHYEERDNFDGPKLLLQVKKRRKIFGYPVEQQTALWSFFFCKLEIVGSRKHCRLLDWSASIAIILKTFDPTSQYQCQYCTNIFGTWKKFFREKWFTSWNYKVELFFRTFGAKGSFLSSQQEIDFVSYLYPCRRMLI